MWKTVVLGAYVGHSECYFGENIWLSHGGRLLGESHKRFGFLYKIMRECGRLHNVGYMTAENEDGSVRLQYFGEHCPSFITINLGDEKYRAEIIDTWNMTVGDKGILTGDTQIKLSPQQYMALWLTREKAI